LRDVSGGKIRGASILDAGTPVRIKKRWLPPQRSGIQVTINNIRDSAKESRKTGPEQFQKDSDIPSLMTEQ
jgi:hypothetical protein